MSLWFENRFYLVLQNAKLFNSLLLLNTKISLIIMINEPEVNHSENSKPKTSMKMAIRRPKNIDNFYAIQIQAKITLK